MRGRIVDPGSEDDVALLDEFARLLRSIVAALVARAGGRVELTAGELDTARNMEIEPGTNPRDLVVLIAES